jgi:hypothetical protein
MIPQVGTIPSRIGAPQDAERPITHRGKESRGRSRYPRLRRWRGCRPRDDGEQRRPPEQARPAGSAIVLLARAVREQCVVAAWTAEAPVVVWPYALGWRGGALYVRALVLRLVGPGRSAGDEEWLRVSDLSALELREAGWIAPGAGPQLALSFFDAVESVGPDYGWEVPGKACRVV